MEQEAYFIERQTIWIEDPFDDQDLILALGGGGEGTIGRLRGRQVVSLDRRRSELEEAPEGSIKVIADARDLPFLDDAFDAVTAFFFLMYVASDQQSAVLREAHRVLKPGGRFYLWDARIPPRRDREERVFVIPLTIHLPTGDVETGYGIPWEGRTQTSQSVRRLAEAAGFRLCDETCAEETFHLVFEKAVS